MIPISQALYAQEFENNSGSREKHFIYTVWQIDEFFNRFNDDPNSFIREIYKTYKVKFKAQRAQLIKSLFNYGSKTWKSEEVEAFVQKALLTKLPSNKNWYGENWYAEAICKFQYNSEVIDIPIILKTYTDSRRRSKWVIAGIRNSIIKNGISLMPVRTNVTDTRFINPTSHGTNFIELSRKFDDKEHLSEYFDNEFFTRKNGLQAYNAILNSKIKFLHVEEIKYHFLNVESYIFTVQYFTRESNNAGWLINQMKPTDLMGKEAYKKRLLGD